MSDVSYYTKEGLKKLKDELSQLKDIERPKASNAIASSADMENNLINSKLFIIIKVI